MENAGFSRLQVSGWRQFSDVDIEIHPRLTVITGANGAGKSTLLGLLASHFGYQRVYPGLRPRRIRLNSPKIVAQIVKRRSYFTDKESVGKVSYTGGASSEILLVQDGDATQKLEYKSRQPVSGVQIDAYRPAPWYQKVESIPLADNTAEKLYLAANGDLIRRYMGIESNSPSFKMKEGLILMSIFGEGNSNVAGDPPTAKAYAEFLSLLRKLLPNNIGFERLEIRIPEVVLVTRTGDFLLDASSGGLMTIMDLAWRVFLFSLRHTHFVVTIDEPENHLHPSMQRELMPKLLDAFPNVQFIVATHSPFVVSSVKDSHVYVLRQTPRAKYLESGLPLKRPRSIASERLDTINRAGSASEILREVLGLEATIPLWVEEGIETLVSGYQGRPITPELLNSLRRDLADLGYEAMYADALARLVGGND